MYKSKYFGLKELFSEDYYTSQHPTMGDLLWMVFDQKGLETIDLLREKYGPALMNTWSMSPEKQRMYGTHNWRGYREAGSKYVKGRNGLKFGNVSQHRFGRAFDLAFFDYTAEEIRQDMRNNPIKPEFEHISRVENDVSWLHIDLGNYLRVERWIKFFNV